jgi:hypothetical protein
VSSAELAVFVISARLTQGSANSDALPLNETHVRFFLCLFRGAFFFRCCGGLFATTSTARSKRAHASGSNSGLFIFAAFTGNPLMPTDAQVAAMNLYAAIMTEVKVRIAAINTGTTNQIPVPPAIVKEFCFLQIRMICELIALGCLVANGDISATKKLQQAWKADEIMEALERLHPEFFPIPSVQKKEPYGYSFEPKKPHPLPKDEFLKIYNRQCGDILHRGNIRKLLSQKSPVQIHYPDITAVAQKLQDLLAIHRVTTRDGKLHFICILFDTQKNMEVTVAIAEAAVPPPSIAKLMPSGPSSRG